MPDSGAGVGLYRIDDPESDAPTVTGPFRLDADGKDVFTGRGITRILVNPDDPNLIFVATTSAFQGVGGSFLANGPDRGVYRSTNALADEPIFEQLSLGAETTDTRITDLVLEPANPNHLLVAVQGFTAYTDGGIYRSTNATQSAPTFVRTLVLPENTNVKLSAAKVGDVVMVLAATSEGNGKLYRSMDGGATWPTVLGAADGFAGASAETDLAIALDPINPDLFYLGGSGTVSKSNDGGASLADVGTDLAAHTRAIVLAPSNSAIVYTGNDSGVWRSTDAAGAWDNLNSDSLTIRNATRLPATAYGPGSPAPLYSGTDRLLRSLDGGATHKIVSQAPFAKDVLGRPLPITSIAISPQDDLVRLVAVGPDFVTGRSRVFATTKGAVKLKDITGSLPAGYIGRIVVDPTDKNTAYVVLGGSGLSSGGHIWRTTNLSDLVNSLKPKAASQWQPVGSGIPDVPVNSLVIDPSDSNVLYAATDAGVYGSVDHAQSWSRFGAKLPQSAIFDVTLDPQSRVLTATTHGLGQWQMQLEPVTPPVFTSASAATFALGKSGSFTVSADGSRPMTLSLSGALPAGVKFVNHGNGTATLSGTPAAKTVKSYGLTITAHSRQGSVAQTFTLTVAQPPKIASAAAATFTAGLGNTFAVISSGFPTAALSLQGKLPAGVTFKDLGTGTGTLAGTPEATTGGRHTMLISADNGSGVTVNQSFTLTINEAPRFTSPATAHFASGQHGMFVIGTQGFPASQISLAGVLPAGLSFVDNGDGTASLTGTPASSDQTAYPLSLTARNAAGTITQNLEVRLEPQLRITGPLSAAFIVGNSHTVTLKARSGAIAALSSTGTLPAGVTFVDNGNNTATLAGAPAAGTSGNYELVIKAETASGATASRTFLLTVGVLPAFTSPNSATFTVGTEGSFAFTTTGNAPPELDQYKLNDLPDGLYFDEETGILSGTPELGTGGNYPMMIFADNGVGNGVWQEFTLHVHQPLTFTSRDKAVMVADNWNHFEVQTAATVLSTLTLTSGTLPEGLVFEDQGNGTAFLTGLLEPGTEGTYTFTVTAHNDTEPDVTQTITLTVKTVAITTDAATEFVADEWEFFYTVEARGKAGYIPVLSLDPSSDPLPEGVTFVDYGVGQATLSGIAVAGSGGHYQLKIRAEVDGVVDVQDFDLYVVERPHFTSSRQTIFTEGEGSHTFLISTTSLPVAYLYAEDELPEGLSFEDQGDGSAILSGTPPVGSAGAYIIAIYAEFETPILGFVSTRQFLSILIQESDS